MVAGGAEGSLNLVSMGGFDALGALSRRNDAPAEACRPFDKERDGFVMAEGSAIMIVEEREHARARGARLYAALAGYGASTDAVHPTAPSPDGDGAARCMRAALDDARVAPADLDYVNAHGTATRINDAVEVLALKRALGEAAKKVMVSSTKSMTGHMLGAGGAAEAAFCALALHHGVVPPTINQRTPDPDCDLDFVPNEARRVPIRAALSNSFGFGGTNASLVLTGA
jgi:3-oxoacyl-[acyl-carrier-protein] synthase II